jgi:uncharacterized membrane protein
MTTDHARQAALKHLKKDYERLTRHERQVVDKVAERAHVSRDTGEEFQSSMTFGQRLADRIASFGGSWPFIIIFLSALLLWVAVNSFVLSHWRNATFDPYPYILLNLILSMLASLQAPVIMMSQNRQSAKDRLDATHDYQVNLKAELEILELHGKLDTLREKQWADLLAMQEQQISLLGEILKTKPQ